MVNQEDRLTSLPQELIFRILYFLSVKEAAKMSTLSRQWRQIYSASPLHLHDYNLIPKPHGILSIERTQNKNQCIQLINQILTSVQNSNRQIYSFTLSRFFLPHIGNDTLLRWFEIVRNKNIQCLTIINDEHPFYQIPKCLLLSSVTVTELKFGYCVLPLNLGFSRIRVLELDHTAVCDECLNGLIARNLNLEILKLSNVKGVKKVRICSESVKVFELENSVLACDVKEIVIENAPMLEKVLLNGHAKEVTKVTILNAPKLR